MLHLRIITSFILILAVVFGIYYLPFAAFNVLAVIVMLMAARELALMFWRERLMEQALFLAVISIFAIVSFVFFSRLALFGGVIWWILLVPLFLMRYVKKEGVLNFCRLVKYLIGIMVFVPFFLALSILREYPEGAGYLLYVLVLVWANDIGAYFAGTFWGKNLLAPAISPKKTLEGLLGGLILAILVIIFGGFLLKVHGIKWVSWIVLSFIVSLWSVIGDLFESMLKRLAQVKDSGSWLPGHGGIYDRIDSLTAALPLFVCGFLIGHF